MLEIGDQGTSDLVAVDIASAGSYAVFRRSVYDLLNSLYGTG